MEQVFNGNQQKIESLKNDEDLFAYISEIENLKLLEDHPNFGQTSWSFIIFSPKNVAMLRNNINQQFLTQPLKEAHEKELSLIEICEGDYENPTQILLTPDIDMEKLKKNWCLEYVKAHQDVLEKVSNKNGLSQAS